MLLGSWIVAACSPAATPAPSPADAGAERAETAACDPPSSFASTAEKTWTPVKARLAEDDALALGRGPAKDVAVRAQLVKDGFAETKAGPGEPWTGRAPDGRPPPAATCSKRLVRFAHLADFQIADDESPARLAEFDAPLDVARAAARPQDAELCVLADAAVRTMNAVHEASPLDFLLLGGDNIDNAQSNELDWVLGVLDGRAGLRCDSGTDSDPLAGPGNDGKDAFDAPGSKVPWYWVTGNHDVLVQGNLTPRDDSGAVTPKAASAVGASAPDGTRDYAKALGNVVSGAVGADPRREVLAGAELLRRVADRTGGPGPKGHGLTPEALAKGRAFYTFDHGAKLRFFVWDSSSPLGGDEGLVYRSDLDGVFKTTLDAAKADGKWVVLVSHHGADRISSDAGAFGRPRAGVVEGQAFVDFVAGYPNVVASIIGHEHAHEIQFRRSSGDPSRGFWEIGTSSIADYPQQFRVVEIFDEGAGWARIRATVVDLDWPSMPAPHRLGRTYAVVDWTSGWGSAGGEGASAAERNVDLWIKP